MNDNKDKNKKLDFDLEFLDEESPKPKQPKRSKARSEIINPSDWNWKTIAIIGGVILVVIWLASGDGSDSTTSPTVPTPNTTQLNTTSFEKDTVIVGEYECSRYHYNRAEELSPDESESQLASEQSNLEWRANELDRLWNAIEYSYVTEYSSQYEIDAYNADVEEYNSKLADYQWDADALDSRIDRYNTQIEAHNNYLTRNCTLNR